MPKGHLYFEVHGQGEPLVLVNGMVRTAAHWGGFETLLASRHQVITYDFRGMGRSTAPHAWRTRMRDMADDVAALLDHLRLDRAHVAGLSLGGMVTMSFGLHHPSRAKSLHLINTSIGGAGLPRATRRSMRMVAKGLVDPRNIDRYLEPMLLSCGAFAPTESRRAEIRALWDRLRAEYGMLLEIGLKHWRVVQGFAGPTSLAAITSPTQVIYGSRDLLVLPANAEVLHRHIPRSVLTRVEGAGHEMTLDRGADVAAAIEAFIQGLAQGERVA